MCYNEFEEGFMKKTILVGAIAAVLALSLTGCLLKKKTTTEEPTTSPALPTLTQTEVTTHTTQFLQRLSKAVSRAKQDFKNDTQLAGIEVLVPGNLNLNLAQEKFLFFSPTDDNWLYVLEYQSQTNKIERSFTFIQDWMGSTAKPEALNSEAVKQSWADALLVAQNQGKIPENLGWVEIELVPSPVAGQPAWSIILQGTTSQTLQVNASTGTLEGAGAPATTSSTTPSSSSLSESATTTQSTSTQENTSASSSFSEL